MLANLNAMIVVLFFSAAVFIIAKPVCLRFMAENDFVRRRNVWIVLTITAFTSPSFWLFAGVAIPLLMWSAYRDPNPVALYVLMMHVISINVTLPIPAIGISELFDLDIYRILSFSILFPTAWRLLHSKDEKKGRNPALMDTMILVYVGLIMVLMLPHESTTQSMRRAFLLVTDILVLYFVVSRVSTNRSAIIETMATYCLACAILVPLALFEPLRNWNLYQQMGTNWGNPPLFAFTLFRENTLRASVSAGHPIPLGFMMATAFGFWLYLSARVQSTRLTWGVAIWIWIGLLAAYSRAPWLVAVALYFIYLALTPKGSAKFFKASLISAVLAGFVLVSPIGGRVIDNLPFIGKVDAETVTYRQRLAEVSWEVIQENPFFGDPFFATKLEDLRQGMGIIDLMNAYADIGMRYGLVTLSALLGFFIAGMWGARRRSRQSVETDPDFSLLGINLIACMLGTLIMMATGGLGLSVFQTFYILAGLSGGYAQISPSLAPEPIPAIVKPEHRLHGAWKQR